MISEQPNDMKINVYESVSFECRAHGYGDIKITWKKANHNIPVTAEVTEEKSLNNISSILKITKSVGYYSGCYYCVVENEVGKVVSQTVNLHVQGNKYLLIAMSVYSILRVLIILFLT